MITSFSAMNKGTFAMNRGTLMFLKRLFLTALGALGLGALASGPAYSQQLPAPDLFDEITRCNPTVPHGGMGNASGLDALLDVDRTADAAMIDSTEKANVLQTVTGAGCNNPVGNGYTMAVTLYDEYVRTKAALPSGRAADEFTQKEFDTAKANKDAYGGAVYNEVYNQRMKRKDADDAIGEYNKLAGMSGEYATFKAQYDDLNFDLWGLRDRDDNDLVGTQLEQERTRAYGMGARGYIPLNGNNTPGDTEIDGTEFEDAFDASGRLRFHPTSDADVASTGVSLILDKFGELEAELKKWKDFEALKKKEYIDNLAAEIGVDPVTGMGTEDNGMSRIDNNENRGMENAMAIEAHAGVIATNAENIKTNADNIMAEQTARVEADMMLAEGVDANKMTGMANMEAIAMNKDMIGTNHGAIMALDGRVGANESAIMRNSGMIGESAFAVGFQVAGEQASFQVGITSSGGETGASAGAGFQF